MLTKLLISFNSQCMYWLMLVGASVDIPLYLASISDTCRSFQLLAILLPIVCVGAFLSKAASRGFAWCCVAGIALYEILLFLLGTISGNLGLIAPEHYRWSFSFAFIVLALLTIKNIPLLFSTLVKIRYRPSWIDPILLGCVWYAALLIDGSLVHDWSTGTYSFDGLNYHIPRALVWAWQGSFAPTATNIWQQVGHPYGGAATLLPITFLGCGWLGGGYTSLIFSIGAVVSLFMITRSFGYTSRPSLICALFFLSCPVLGWRLADTSTDVAATFPILAAVALVRSPLNLRRSLFIFPILVALGTAIKQYVLFPAIPLSLVLFLPHAKSIVTSRRYLATAMSAIVVGFFLAFLSFYPIYGVFGNLTGDGIVLTLSNFSAGWVGVWRSISLVLLEWTFESLRFLPSGVRQAVFDDFSLSTLFDYFGFEGYNGLLAPPDREHCRAGLLSLVLLPWMIAAIPGSKKKILALLGLATIFFAQCAPLAVNHVGARFAILPVAMFCLLFSARALRSPFVTSLLLLFVLYQASRYVPTEGVLRGRVPQYNPQNEWNRDIYSLVRDDKVLLLGRSLSVDAKVSGLLGQIRFEYFKCPNNQDWQSYFQEIKQDSKWIVIASGDYSITPGPSFRTVLGPPCKTVALPKLRQDLRDAGWTYRITTAEVELWGHSSVLGDFSDHAMR